MRKTILFLLFLLPVMLFGQPESGSNIVGSIDGTINVSVLGGAVYSIPLEIPQGVNGMQPEIGIIYNSQGGNGLLGYGWNINGISTINRTGSTLYHNGKMTAADFSSDDQFTLDGQRLILVGNSGSSYEYKTENDEFSKIVFTKVNGYYSTCEVRLENGNIIKYGYTANSKLMAADGNNVIKWMVSSIEDRNGNTVSYVYETNGTDSDIYIKDILYTSNSLAGLSAQFKVSFSYSNSRFDNYHYYIAGNKVLCNRILTGINVLKGNEVIVSYGFTYDSNTNRMFSILKEISLSKGNYTLNPTVIQWNTEDSDVQNNTLSSQHISTDLVSEFSFVGDFNGDGYSDLLTVPYRPVLGYQGNVSIKCYLNDMQGGFPNNPTNTIQVADSIDWIHVLDINDDGYDDFVVQTLVETNHYNPDYTTYNTGFIVYESQQGNGFIQRNSYNIPYRLLVRSGDFMGEGKAGLLLCPITVGNTDDNFYYLNGTPYLLHYESGYSLESFIDYVSYVGALVTGDFTGDGKTNLYLLNGSSSTSVSFYKQSNAYRVSTTNFDFDSDMDLSYFTGDFNNDGKTDIFFNDNHNHKYVALSTGVGFTDWIRVSNSTLNSLYLPQMHTYRYSLSNVSQNTSYGVDFSDLDGDGKTDIIYYNGNNMPVFFRDFNITDNGNGLFKIEYQASNSVICFMSQFFTMGNFLGHDNVSFVAVDPNGRSTLDDYVVNIFSFTSVSNRFSVSSITDGMGKAIDIKYAYLMPGQANFYDFTNRPYINDVKPCPVPLLAMWNYTESVGQNTYTTSFRYGNTLMHRTGRGFVNFESVEKTSSINNILVKQEKSSYELTTMGANAVALPQCDSTFLYNGANKILSETNSYTFTNVKCSRQQTSSGFRHIVRPAMTKKKTKRFSPDIPGDLMSVEIVEYTYNYSNYMYSDTYNCTYILTGYNRNDCNSFYSCEYNIGTQYQYKTNDYTNWIINRKSVETTNMVFANQSSISRKKSYTYSNTSPFLVTSFTDIPKGTGTSPLTVRHEYQYDACGNVVSETTSAPNGTQNEAPVVTNYSYSNYRLVASKTIDPNGLAYQDQYSYDKYDRVTSHVGCNGLTTTYSYNNPFGSIVTTNSPGNVVTAERIAWAAGEDLAPSGALYCKYRQTSGGAITEEFYDGAGNTIRTVAFNYELEPAIVDVRYNARQLPVRQSYPYLEGDTPQWTLFQYDGLGRLTSTTTPDGTVVSNTYNGFTTTTTTTSGNTTRTASQTINYMGWVTSNTDAGNATVSYTYYSDGKVASMTTSGGNVTVNMTYDNARNRTVINDADYGQATSVYDAYGRIKRQTTPNNDQFNYTYDVLGRLTQKTVQGDATTTSYQYNESTHKGTLASVTHNGQTLQYAYDNYDRLTSVTETRTDTTYTTSYTYNYSSQISSKTYPSGYQVYYTYFPNGAKKLIRDAGGNILWRANEINASGQLLRATTGNGAVTTNRYDVETNRLTGSVTSNGIQNFAYTFDGFGNLTSRTDSIGTIKTETFTYDNLDRLTGITLNNVSSTIVYDSYGRMTSKQKDGAYVFTSALFGQTKPHATRSVSTTSSEFPISQIAEYNSLDKVKRLTQDSKIATFTYGYDGQRMRMTVTDTLTGRTKTKDYVGNCEFINDNGTKRTYTYLTCPYGVFAMVISSGNNHAVHYVYKDHLGSWTTITDSIGTVVERKSFDAWGNLRDPSTWSGSPSRPPKFDRGFTGHEHLYSFGLINMNGRMYDPLLSSFLSPDNYMQDPTSQQDFNRYAYCMYNPLKYVDPSGERQMGWIYSTYQWEQEARTAVTKEWERVYDVCTISHNLTHSMACSVYSKGTDACGGRSGSGNHGSPGGSVEVKAKGDGKYEVVKGLYDGGNTVYIVDDQGNRTGEILGHTLTQYTFYNQDGSFVENQIIDLNDYSGQDFWNTYSDDLPFKIVYEIDMIFGARGGFWESAYDFKKFEDKPYRAMMIDFGFGNVIATGRDIGNFFAGYLWGFSGTPYIETRTLFNLFQFGPEPNVSKYAQDFGYFWGLYNLNKHNKKP